MGFSYSSPRKLIHSPINSCLSVFISLLWTLLKGLLFISLLKEPSRAPGIYKKCLLNEWMKDFPDSETWSWATDHLLSYFPHYFYSSSTILILIVWTCVSVLHIESSMLSNLFSLQRCHAGHQPYLEALLPHWTYTQKLGAVVSRHGNMPSPKSTNSKTMVDMPLF